MQFLFQLPNFYASWFGIVATLLVTSTKLLYMKPDDATNIHVCMGKLPWCVSDYWQWFWPPRKKSSKPMFCITRPVTRNAGIVI